MATDVVSHAYNRWPHRELSTQNESQEVSISRMLDHGSISFGRYAVEPLAWEKRSVFTFNKRQEELEKCRVHGLVAQKKAFFEEYYKRTRSVKTLKDNQQTELTLNHGGDFSMSSQSGQEDKTAPEINSLGGEVSSVSSVTIEKGSTGIALEKVADCIEALQVTDLNPQHSTSPSKTVDEIKQETDFTELEIVDSCVTGEEKINHHNINTLHNLGVSRNDTNLFFNGELAIAGQVTALSSTDSKPGNTKFTETDNIKRDKNSQRSKMKKESISVPKLKVPAPSTKNTLNLKDKPVVESSHGSRPAQNKVGRIDVCNRSYKTAADNHASTSVTTVTKGCSTASTFTISRPFSFATDRRTTSLSGIRNGGSRVESTTAARSVPSLIHDKDIKTVKGTSKKATTTSGLKGRAIEEKRVFKQDKEADFTLGSSLCGPKRRGANILGSVKSRTLDLLKRNKLDPCSETDNKMKDNDRSGRKEAKTNARSMQEVHAVNLNNAAATVTGNFKEKRTEVKANKRSMMKISTASSKHTAASQAGNLKEKNAKKVQLRNTSLSLNSKEPQYTHLSLLERKPRQEKPHWR